MALAAVVTAAAAVVATALVVVGPASAQSSDPLSGEVLISVHSHSNNDPVFPGLLFPSKRLSYDFAQGESFSYSSRTCDGAAPFNEIGLDFRPDYPGVDDKVGTAPVRHRSQGTLTEVNGDTGTIEGTITSVLCVTENGAQTESENVIVSDYRAGFRRTSDNELQLSGSFEISPAASTGTFKNLTGGGSLEAIITCLAHSRNPSAPTCEQNGEFADFVALRGDTSLPPGKTTPGLIGTFAQGGNDTDPPPSPTPPTPPAPTPPANPCGNPGGAGYLNPAKMRVSRAQVLREDRQLDVLAPITSRARGGEVDVLFEADGRKDAFDAEVTEADTELDEVRFLESITEGQADLGTGIVNLSYLGNDGTRPEFVRLRAASQRAELDVEEISLLGDRLSATGSVTDRA
ncbi:MAG: hypothetical protein M3R46_14505, partial [Actinomycetota bacterium]|nr:hypothetical protein [Actinomycetota bacterium]